MSFDSGHSAFEALRVRHVSFLTSTGAQACNAGQMRMGAAPVQNRSRSVNFASILYPLQFAGIGTSQVHCSTLTHHDPSPNGCS